MPRKGKVCKNQSVNLLWMFQLLKDFLYTFFPRIVSLLIKVAFLLNPNQIPLSTVGGLCMVFPTRNYCVKKCFFKSLLRLSQSVFVSKGRYHLPCFISSSDRSNQQRSIVDTHRLALPDPYFLALTDLNAAYVDLWGVTYY